MLSNGLLAAYGVSLFGLSYPLFGNLCESWVSRFNTVTNIEALLNGAEVCL